MNILILYFNPDVQELLELVLDVENYDWIATQHATEAIRIIAESADSCLLLADNFDVNPEARQAFTMLHDRPDLRQRVWVVGASALHDVTVIPWLTDGMIDEHLHLSLNPDLEDQCSDPDQIDQFLAIIAAHTSDPPR